ncbi:MAG: alginate lyase family protein [bacterium]
MGREPTINNIRTALHIPRYLGLNWVLFRVLYAGKQRLGLLQRRFPMASWDDKPLKDFLKEPALADPEVYLRYRREDSPVFLFNPGQRQRFAPFFKTWKDNNENLLSYAGQIGQGRFCYFNHERIDTGFPPAWHINPFSGEHIPPDRHWSKIGDFDNGDIKVVWELNRFGFVYPLVRAYWRTGNDLYARLFWQLIESWMARNHPHQGPNWKCGQEISFRLMAWCFGLYGFLNSGETTADRVAALARMIAFSGERIASVVSYALSQKNNHAISEGMGLWTIGTLFPELKPAEAWEGLGRHILETQGRELIYEDGSFAQHSLNYQRLMIQDYLWSLRLGDLHDKPFSRELKERLGKSVLFLYQVQDKESGQVPLYGQNDGSLVLPLNGCGYHDFRPVIQAAHYLVTGSRCFPPGPWDEDLLWLFGEEALKAPVISLEKKELKADTGGYYTLRSSDGFILTRCASFRHRPGQADMLHADLWWKGQNIALDPGTCSYNADTPWDNPFSHTAYHNTVTVDGLDQMKRVSRFLWLPWISGRVIRYQESAGKQFTYWEGEHTGYSSLKQGVRHCRGILRLGTDYWLVLDALRSKGEHSYRLHWLFPDVPHIWDEKSGSLRLQTAAGDYYIRMAEFSGKGEYLLIRADEESPRGWRSPYYNHREPALSVDLVSVKDNAYFRTLFGPEDCKVDYEKDILHIEGNAWTAEISLRFEAGMSLIRSASIKGKFEDKIEINR